jgi:hypothetical protein
LPGRELSPTKYNTRLNRNIEGIFHVKLNEYNAFLSETAPATIWSINLTSARIALIPVLWQIIIDSRVYFNSKGRDRFLQELHFTSKSRRLFLLDYSNRFHGTNKDIVLSCNGTTDIKSTRRISYELYDNAYRYIIHTYHCVKLLTFLCSVSI